MPCDSSYLEPTEREKEQRRAATLLVYVLENIGQAVTSGLRKQAANIYGEGPDCIPLLCKTLKALSALKRNKIIYNARNKTARDLADWWEEHQNADRQRERLEKAEAQRKKLVASALKKLTKAEQRALRGTA